MGPSLSSPDGPPADSGPPSGYPTNPYLTYRPIFARSLPIQILVTGITLTLVSVLLIQLLFSAPSHMRIARTNFSFKYLPPSPCSPGKSLPSPSS